MSCGRSSAAPIPPQCSSTELAARPSARQLRQDERACTRVDGEAPGCRSQVAQGVGDENLGILIFLPDAQVVAIVDLVLGALPLESGRDDDRTSGDGKKKCKESFAAPPLNPGEVLHVRAWLDQHRGEAELSQQRPRLLSSLLSLRFANRRRCVGTFVGFGRLRNQLSDSLSNTPSGAHSGRCRTSKRGRALNKVSAFQMVLDPQLISNQQCRWSSRLSPHSTAVGRTPESSLRP